MAQGHKTCAILALMKHCDVPETREEFLKLFYMGNVPEEIAAEEECQFPEKFQLATLTEKPPASEKLQ